VRSANELIWKLGRRMFARDRLIPTSTGCASGKGLPSLVEAVPLPILPPQLNLQLYSPEFAEMPQDWTAGKKAAGFCLP